MNARPVIHAGSERPERKKSRSVLIVQPRDEADPEHDDEVDRQDHVVDRARMQSQHADPLLMAPATR